MKRYRNSASNASTYTQKNLDPADELRHSRAAFGEASLRLEAAALSTRSPLHSKRLSTLARLAAAAARPLGAIILRLEQEDGMRSFAAVELVLVLALIAAAGLFVLATWKAPTAPTTRRPLPEGRR